VMLCLRQMIGNSHQAPAFKFPPPGAKMDSLALDREKLMKRTQDFVGLGTERLKQRGEGTSVARTSARGSGGLQFSSVRVNRTQDQMDSDPVRSSQMLRALTKHSTILPSMQPRNRCQAFIRDAYTCITEQLC